MAQSECLYSFQASQPVDAVESVSLSDNRVGFVIGCYELIEAENKRVGSIQVGTLSHRDPAENVEDDYGGDGQQEASSTGVELARSKANAMSGEIDINVYSPHSLNWGLLDFGLKKIKTDSTSSASSMMCFGVGSDASLHVLRITIPEDWDNNNKNNHNNKNETQVEDVLNLSHLNTADRAASLQKDPVIGLGCDIWVSTEGTTDRDEM